MRTGTALVCTIILLPAVHAAATPYLIAYEGDVYPEQAGWERYINAGGADRSLDNGILTLWSLDDNQVADLYIFDMNEQLNAGPDELFFVEWRMRLVPASGSSDVGLFIATDDYGGALDTDYAESGFRSIRENQTAFLDTTVFHTYRLESEDMVNYNMLIDGAIAWQGFFATPTLSSSLVEFGDLAVGTASASQWDYFRFGVVPEPGCPLLLAVGLFLAPARRCAKAYTCKPSPEHRNLNTAPPPSS